ncbi:nucleotidyltransferase [Azotobacter chroococcum]|nr:nucleotidyltransferase [Azotobacter chroococcum]
MAYSPWARALNEVNLHITVRPEEIAEAVEAYNEVAHLLVAKLHWPLEAISILPQGSASTKTLIRSPIGNQKFDIDAVCQVDISEIDASDPMGFFQSVGDALGELEAEAKKRCWNIPFPKKPFYLEFTPSVPLATVSAQTPSSIAPRYRAAQRYQATALAVADTPTEQWKTSNPEGITTWVDDTAKRRLIVELSMEAMAIDKRADVAPVPSQEVQIIDTLRVAIRLFKRHRDMCVRRGIIAADVKPISIIIVTLLTSCYEGLADLGRTYNHPVELLDELASLMSHLVLKLEGQYRVDNPTVDGENFAEKWNQDGGARYRAFVAWCNTLSADLKTILALTDPQEISKRAREVFGIPAPTIDDTGLSSIGYRTPPATRPGRGLA